MFWSMKPPAYLLTEWINTILRKAAFFECLLIGPKIMIKIYEFGSRAKVEPVFETVSHAKCSSVSYCED